MSREKYIEEMAEHMIEIQRNFNEYCAKPCRGCELGGIVNCENHYKAEALYNAGYRKQSEGEWVRSDEHTEQHGYLYKCSCCGVLCWLGNFCPNCGASMSGGKSNDS